jgi:soluble lytic murein transglycosylase-like protein
MGRLFSVVWPYIPIVFWLLLAVLVVRCTVPEPAFANIPAAANAHRATLVRTAHYGMGLDAPVATLAAQIHQESGWNSNAVSPAGAQGLAQFMPATADWMATLNPVLQNPQPFNAGWAIRAMVQYNQWHLNKFPSTNTPSCQRWALALSAYNGGLGWVYREQKLARASGARGLAWFGDVERFNAGRSLSNFAENRNYVRNILIRWEPMYAAAGWGNGVCTHDV